MKNKRLFFLMGICACLCCLQLQAQTQPNLKFGKPTNEELTMEAYAPDVEAKAVVLCKTTKVWYDLSVRGFRLYKEVNARIKVLKQEGVEYANVEVPYYHDEKGSPDKEEITGLKAYAYNMEVGKMVKTKMENASVSRERLDKARMVLKFSVPQVKVGTVIEYEYKKESDFFFNIDTWYAQESIPVAYTSYELTVPEYFKFNIDQTGGNKTETKRDTKPLNLMAGGQVLRCVGNVYSVVGRELPALKDDDYVYCVQDYCNKVTAELRGVEVPGEIYKNYTTTWEEIATGLIGDDDFGKRIKRTCPIKDLVPASGAADKVDVVEKMAAIVSAMRQRLKWNGEYGFFGQSAAKVIKEGTGNNADLNFILISAFREAGLDARPVVMSRRNRGRLPFSHPSLNKLNTFVVAVCDGDNMHFVDASAEDAYIDVLPSTLLVEQAMMIDDNANCQWLNLQALESSKCSISIEATLNTDATVKGSYKAVMTGNFAAAARKEYKNAGDNAAYVDKKAKEHGVEIDSHELKGKDDYKPSVEEAFEFTKNVDATGEHFYVAPFLVDLFDESPFKEQERKLPVEFPFKEMVNANIVLHLPQGCTIEEKPQQVFFKTDDEGISYRAKFIAKGSDLVVQCRMMVNKMFFANEEYPFVKQIFDAIAEKEKEMLVVKKGI